MIKLEAKNTEFFSDKDEENFFVWLKSIGCIKNIRGIGPSVLIDIEDVCDDDLREIIAVFHRYKIDMIQLRDLRTNNNEHWFTDERMFWHQLVFGSSA